MHIRWVAAGGVAVIIATLIAGCTGTPGGGSAGVPTSTARPTSTAPPTSDTYPNAMAVLGHSGATGFDSDPKAPSTDAPQNSWATGTNPAVDSIYLRLLAVNPAIKGHATNVAVSGSNVSALPVEVDEALRARPIPQLFLIQSVDNDMQCDGTDATNYAPFRQQLTAALHRIAKGAPGARILIVSSPWATATDYVAAVRTSEQGRTANTGPGPCAAWDFDGKLHPEHMAYFEAVAHHYFAEVAASCRTVPACRYDGGVLHTMHVTPADITSDFNHLTIAGQAKQAALEWKVLSKDY